MNHYSSPKFLSLFPAFFLFFILAYNSAAAQNTAQAETKYVRVDIGHGGLHCPFLGPQMEKKIKELGDVNNYKMYRQESYATFELPVEKPVTDADIRQVAIKVGYPEADVSVVISDTPPVNQQ